jgi:hypothetical protein
MAFDNEGVELDFLLGYNLTGEKGFIIAYLTDYL